MKAPSNSVTFLQAFVRSDEALTVSSDLANAEFFGIRRGRHPHLPSLCSSQCLTNWTVPFDLQSGGCFPFRFPNFSPADSSSSVFRSSAWRMLPVPFSDLQPGGFFQFRFLIFSPADSSSSVFRSSVRRILPVPFSDLQSGGFSQFRFPILGLADSSNSVFRSSVWRILPVPFSELQSGGFFQFRFPI
jgi:hypothetical protein